MYRQDMERIVHNLQSNLLVAICIALLLFFFVLGRFDASYEDIFGLVTVNTLIANAYIWNLLTCSFYESSVLKLAVDLLILTYIPSESLHMAPVDQFALFLVFSLLACSLGTSAYCLLRFFSTGLEETVMEPIFGFNGLLIAYLTFVRQTLKRQPIHLNVNYITYHNIPILILLLQLSCWVVGLKAFYRDIPFTLISLLFSWSYLKFFYKHENGDTGNQDPDFDFVVMFPPVLQPVMVPLSTAFYNILALLGVFPALMNNPSSSVLPQHHHLRYNSF